MKRLLRTFLFVSLGLAVVGVGHSDAALNPGDILVVDFSAAGGNGAVIIVDPGLGTQTLLSSTQFFRDPFGITIDDTGRIFVADGTANAVIEVDNTTGIQSVVHVGAPFVTPVGISDAPGGLVYVADASGAVYTVMKDFPNTVTLVVGGPPLVTPFDVQRNKFGTFYLLDRDAGGGTVYELPALTVVSSGGLMVKPYGMAIDQGAPFFPANEPGGIYVADITVDKVILIDPNTGAQTDESVGQNFSFPSGLTIGAFPAFSTPFYAADFGANAVIQFDPGVDPLANQTVISSGGLFVNPVRLTTVPERPVQTEEKTWGGIKGQYR